MSKSCPTCGTSTEALQRAAEIIQRSGKRITELKADLLHANQSLGVAMMSLKEKNERIAELETWKRGQLTVKQWWDEVDELTRSHPDIVLGESVAKAAMRFIRRDIEHQKRVT